MNYRTVNPEFDFLFIYNERVSPGLMAFPLLLPQIASVATMGRLMP